MDPIATPNKYHDQIHTTHTYPQIHYSSTSYTNTTNKYRQYSSISYAYIKIKYTQNTYPIHII